MRAHGFSLLELLVALALMAVLMLAATPSLRGIIASQRVSAVSVQLERALMLARQLAVNHQDDVNLCPQAGCGSSWQQPWQLLMGSQVLRQLPGASNSVTIQWRGSFGRAFPRYNSDGTAAYSGSFSVCLQSQCKKVILARTGRVRVE